MLGGFYVSVYCGADTVHYCSASDSAPLPPGDRTADQTA